VPALGLLSVLLVTYGVEPLSRFPIVCVGSVRSILPLVRLQAQDGMLSALARSKCLPLRRTRRVQMWSIPPAKPLQQWHAISPHKVLSPAFGFPRWRLTYTYAGAWPVRVHNRAAASEICEGELSTASCVAHNGRKLCVDNTTCVGRAMQGAS
jgi:hypothetical protein